MKIYSFIAAALITSVGFFSHAQRGQQEVVQIKRVVIHALYAGRNVTLNQYEPLLLKLDDQNVNLTFKGIDTSGNEYRLAAKFWIANPEFLSATFGNGGSIGTSRSQRVGENAVLFPQARDWYGEHGTLNYSLDLPANFRLVHGARPDGSIEVHVTTNEAFEHAFWVVDGAYKAILYRSIGEKDGLKALEQIKFVMKSGLPAAINVVETLATFNEATPSQREGGALAVVGNLYRHLLRRPGTDLEMSRSPRDGAAFNKWVRDYSAGRLTFRELVYGIASSPEYALENGF